MDTVKFGWKRNALSLALLLGSAILVTLASAPFNQFYLGWICLVPWLVVMMRASSPRRAFGWGWLGGFIVFSIHAVSIYRLTISGALALCAALAITWAIAGWSAHILLREPAVTWTRALRQSIAFALIWTGCEWLRGRLIIDYPIYLLGHTQGPFLALAQIADLAGAYGVTLIVAGINACIAQIVMTRRPARSRLAIAAPWTVALALAFGYGAFRLAHPATNPGPRVMVVQSNNPFHRGGEPGIGQQEHLQLLLQVTQDGLNRVRGNNEPPIDLIVWPESITPPINPEARRELAHFEAGPLLAGTFDALARLARDERTSVIVGGYSVSNWQMVAGKRTGTDIRNSAYLFDSSGDLAGRYDKLHLVPFGEYLPLKFRLLQWLAPRPLDVPLRAGDTTSQLTLSGPQSYELLPAICLEDNLAEQIRSRAVAGARKPDVIVSLSNDGWFRREFMAQRLAAAQFVCIENRMPMARSENGGISAFLDSSGRIMDAIPAWQNGSSVREMMLDPRVTLYQKTGDILPPVGLLVLVVLLVRGWIIRLPRATGASGEEAAARR
jgi:apolipoprotein N-acyltransferase